MSAWVRLGVWWTLLAAVCERIRRQRWIKSKFGGRGGNLLLLLTPSFGYGGNHRYLCSVSTHHKSIWEDYMRTYPRLGLLFLSPHFDEQLRNLQDSSACNVVMQHLN